MDFRFAFPVLFLRASMLQVTHGMLIIAHVSLLHTLISDVVLSQELQSSIYQQWQLVADSWWSYDDHIMITWSSPYITYLNLNHQSTSCGHPHSQTVWCWWHLESQQTAWVIHCTAAHRDLFEQVCTCRIKQLHYDWLVQHTVGSY